MATFGSSKMTEVPRTLAVSPIDEVELCRRSICCSGKCFFPLSETVKQLVLCWSAILRGSLIEGSGFNFASVAIQETPVTSLPQELMHSSGIICTTLWLTYISGSMLSTLADGNDDELSSQVYCSLQLTLWSTSSNFFSRQR